MNREQTLKDKLDMMNDYYKNGGKLTSWDEYYNEIRQFIKTELTRLQERTEDYKKAWEHHYNLSQKLQSQIAGVDIEFILGIISDYKEYVGDNMLEMTSNSIKSQEKVLLAILNKESKE